MSAPSAETADSVDVPNSENAGRHGPVVIGVDLGGTKVLARAVDPATGRAWSRGKVPTPAGPDAVLATIVDVVRQIEARLVDQLEGEPDVAGVGVGFPGFVTPDGVVARCPNIVGWDHPVEAAAILSAALGHPVVVGNDVNCGAVAEHRLGGPSSPRNLLAVFVGTGVGGGLILDDRLVVGPRGMAAEIGHVTVEPGGRPCGCGGLGHLESYAGRSGMVTEIRRLEAEGSTEFLAELAQGGPVKSKHLLIGWDKGDETTHRLVAEAAGALAQVVGNMATMLDLERVVLGGGVVDKLGSVFLDQVRSSDRFGGFGPDHVEVVEAQRLDDAGAVGAAFLAADQLLGAVDRVG